MRRWLGVVVVLCSLVVGCGGDGAEEQASGSAGGAGIADLDPCSLLTEDVATDLVGAEVTRATGSSFGQAIGCSYEASSDTGGNVGAALAELTFEQDDDATPESLLADAQAAAGEDDEVSEIDVGDGGVQVVTDTDIQVTYVVHSVVIKVRVTPKDGVGGDDVDKALGFVEDSAVPITAAVEADPTLTFASGVDEFLGTWDSTFGTMEIRLVDGRILAAYEVDEGTITFEEVDGEFRGWWTETPSRDVPTDAGSVVFRASSDAEGNLIFDGQWSYDDVDTLDNDWDLTPLTDGVEPSPELEARFDDPDAFVDHP